MSKRIGCTGFSGKAILEQLSGQSDFKSVFLVVDGTTIAGGEVDEATFVDGGIMFTVKEPKPDPTPPTRDGQ